MDINNRTQYRAWCFTLNNYKPDLSELNGIDHWQYMVVGYEVADSGTPHLQGYVYFNKRRTFAAVSRMVPKAHWTKCNGTPEQNRDYCTKDGKYDEFGDFPDTQGGASGGNKKAAVYQRAIQLSKSGDFDKMEEQYPHMYWNSYHTMKRIAMDNPQPKDPLDKLDNEWIYGEPGVGKSFTARKENPGLYIKLHNKWWLGYKGEAVVLYDDLGKTDSTWIGEFLKTWGDHYPFPAETKGDGMLIRPERIIVTSNYSIDELFGHDDQLCSAIKRRFKTRHMIPIDDL